MIYKRTTVCKYGSMKDYNVGDSNTKVGNKPATAISCKPVS